MNSQNNNSVSPEMWTLRHELHSIKEELNSLKVIQSQMVELMTKVVAMEDDFEENRDAHKLVWQHIHDLEKEVNTLKTSAIFTEKTLSELRNDLKSLNENISYLKELFSNAQPLLDFIKDFKSKTLATIFTLIGMGLLALGGWLLYVYRIIGGPNK